MSNLRLLICDSDRAYVEALVAYLVSCRERFFVSTYYEKELFEQDVGKYDIAILGDGFIEMTQRKAEISKVIYLSAVPGAVFESCDTIYKFQDMHTFLEKLTRGIDPVASHVPQRVQTKWTGIYSPIRHELQLPFALTYAKQFQEEGAVLFLDLEENSILGELIDLSGTKNLMDYLYLLEDDTKDRSLCISSYEGMSLLPPMPYFADLTQVDETLWKQFYASVSTLDYDKVILLFDGAISGMAQAIPYMKELILLSKPGDYYKKSNRRVDTFLKIKGKSLDIKYMDLPMTGKNLVDGTYHLPQLLSGNLGRFVRDSLETTGSAAPAPAARTAVGGMAFARGAAYG